MEFVFPCQSGGFKAFRNESDESARRLTSRGPDGGGDGGRAHGRHTLVILRVAGLDGTQVAVAACAEAAGQIQRLHGLRFHLAEHRLAHRLELAVHLSLAHLKRPECRFFFSPSNPTTLQTFPTFITFSFSESKGLPFTFPSHILSLLNSFQLRYKKNTALVLTEHVLV